MASKYLNIFPIPDGFANLMHDYARDVLRDQPDDVIDYSYLYFKALEEVKFNKLTDFIGNAI
jgi:hypothetical protein